MRRRNPEQIESLSQMFSDVHADYNAARTSQYRVKLTGVNPMGSGGDYHYRREADYLRILELTRMFDRDDIVVGQGITRLIRNVLQGGIRLDPQTGDKEANKVILERWNQWSEEPDECNASGRFTLHEMAHMGLRATIVDGDIFFMRLGGGQLQPVESHRCRTPRNTKRNVRNGVLLDGLRKPLEYWFTKDDIDPRVAVNLVSEIERVPARDKHGNIQVFHLAELKRFSQTRGISKLAPIVDAIGIHNDLQFAQLLKAQLAACFAILRTMDEGQGLGDGKQVGTVEKETLDDGMVSVIENIRPGIIITGRPGDTLQGFSPNIPNQEFFPHTRLILSFIAINLDMPVNLLLLDPSDTNFSGWRGAMDQARMGFRCIQDFMVCKFYKPIYLWKMREWVESDSAIRNLAKTINDVDLVRHRFNRGNWPYIEPLKDAKADATKLNENLISPRRLQAERGRDWPDITEEIAADKGLLITEAIKQADAINLANPGANLQWRELIGLDLPVDGRRTASQPGQDRDDDDPEPINPPKTGKPR